MLKVASIVEEIVATSEFALEGIQNGCLNLSAYAKQILPIVEAKTKKPVTLGSIVAALSRLPAAQNTNDLKPFTPDIEAYNLLSRSGLAEITYVKTPQNQALVTQLYNDPKFASAQFFVVTLGLSEISIITTEEAGRAVVELFAPQKPKLYLTNLASLSMQMPESGIETPNQFYTIIKQFALKRINIVEFVTTYTELSFILDNKDLKQAFNLLHDAFFAPE
jgi:aspartokinase